jgi:hypothetical protein
MSKQKLVHCPNCPDQGWYQDYKDDEVFYGQDENGADIYRIEKVPVQVQCEFCWTNPNSYFNAAQTATCNGAEKDL